MRLLDALTLSYHSEPRRIGVYEGDLADEAIDASGRVLSLLSPDYVKSKICIEELNIALHRRRDTGDEIVSAVYVHSADLPTYMRALINYEDCREGDAGKLRAFCQKLVGVTPEDATTSG